MIWKPNVTVATVIEHGRKFLLVEEEALQGLRYNQPAGHLDADEPLIAAVIRETPEKLTYHFTPQHLVGIYRGIPLNRIPLTCVSLSLEKSPDLRLAANSTTV